MTRFALKLLALGMLMLGLVSCGSEALDIPPAGLAVQHTVTFVGNVWDGATGARMSGYTIVALAGETSVQGSVDGDGRYVVGPIGVWDDFTIIIDVDGYRAFRSHNAQVGLPAGLAGSDDISDLSTHQTLHYDAYLFPADLQAPAVTFTIKTPVVGETPTGKIRLRATTPSILADDGIETPAGIPGQVWDNDEDLQAGTINDSFSDGQFSLQAGELVYGVTYRVSIYEVDGYQPFTGSYQAGVEADKSFTLVEAVHEPIQVVSSTMDTCAPPASPGETNSAVVLVQFNQNVELGASNYPGGNAEAIDDGLQIVTADDDGDQAVNELEADSSDNAQERATAIDVTGNQLELSWNPSLGLATQDPEDAITQVTYGGLGNVSIQRPSAPASAIALSSVLGTSAITCQ